IWFLAAAHHECHGEGCLGALPAHSVSPRAQSGVRSTHKFQQSTNCVIVLPTTSPYSLRLLSRVILTKTCWPASCCLPQPCTTILLVRRRSLKCSRINLRWTRVNPMVSPEPKNNTWVKTAVIANREVLSGSQ